MHLWPYTIPILAIQFNEEAEKEINFWALSLHSGLRFHRVYRKIEQMPACCIRCSVFFFRSWTFCFCIANRLLWRFIFYAWEYVPGTGTTCRFGTFYWISPKPVGVFNFRQYFVKRMKRIPMRGNTWPTIALHINDVAATVASHHHPHTVNLFDDLSLLSAILFRSGRE